MQMSKHFTVYVTISCKNYGVVYVRCVDKKSEFTFSFKGFFITHYRQRGDNHGDNESLCFKNDRMCSECKTGFVENLNRFFK